MPDALSKGILFSLNMAELKVAQSGPIEWNIVQELAFPKDYNPVMALAQNHIHFLDVGSDGPGEARIFVIHCKFFSPKWEMVFSCTSSRLPPT